MGPPKVPLAELHFFSFEQRHQKKIHVCCRRGKSLDEVPDVDGLKKTAVATTLQQSQTACGRAEHWQSDVHGATSFVWDVCDMGELFFYFIFCV